MDVHQAGALAGFLLEELVDGRWWLKGSTLGAVHLQVSIDPLTIDQLAPEQLGVPMVESGPDRRYGLLDVDILYPSSAFSGPETTPGTLTLEIMKVGLQVLEWLQERYQLPELPYHSVARAGDRARSRDNARHTARDAAHAPVVTSGPSRALEDVLDQTGPGYLGVFVPYREDEQWVGGPRIDAIHNAVETALAGHVVQAEHGDQESLQDAVVWFYPLADVLKE